MMPSLSELLIQFALLSLVAFGGGNAILPDMYRLVVENHNWLTSREFNELFALAQAAPGPNILVVSLIGLHLGGISGFFVITFAFCMPSSLLMYGVNTWWSRSENIPWRRHINSVIGALATGLVLTGGGLMGANIAHESNWTAAILIFSTVALVLSFNVNPLWWIVVGAVLGGLESMALVP